MKKNHIIFTIGGIALLLAATASLAALDYYVRAQGTAQVSTPEFYIGSAQEETLLINEKPSHCAHFQIDGQYRTFITNDLGGVNFNYIPQARFSVRAKITDTITPQDLVLNFGYYKTNGSGPHYLCSETVSLGTELDNYTTDFIICNEAPQNVKSFFYEFKKEGCGEDCNDYDYTISKCSGGFYTKIELEK